MDLSTTDHVLAGAAAVAAGLINALAGGGTLITFPALVALGVPTVHANVTNTVALSPGYFGGTFAQRRDLADQPVRLRFLASAAGIGGLVGSILLVSSPERLFRDVVPFLLLAACALLAFQDRIKRLIPASAQMDPHADGRPGLGAMAAILVAAIYGGYFGAGLSIIFIAMLGLLLDDKLARLNALKQGLSFVTNTVAALFFVGSGKVEWTLVAVMAPASLVGGAVGGKLAGRINPMVLRALVIASGVAITVKLFLD
jgi:uncharacterized membrane protein YfcA